MAEQTFEVIEVPAVDVALVRGRTTLTRISSLIDGSVGEIFGAIQAQGRHVTGAWFLRYLGAPAGPDTEFDVELGFPVDAPVMPAGRVEPGTLGGCRVARTVVTGSYDGLSDAWSAISTWMARSGLEAAGAPWEAYLNNPAETAEEDLRTEINIPLA